MIQTLEAGGCIQNCECLRFSIHSHKALRQEKFKNAVQVITNILHSFNHPLSLRECARLVIRRTLGGIHIEKRVEAVRDSGLLPNILVNFVHVPVWMQTVSEDE